MDKSFKDIRIVDNFYQSSSFFPMPLCLIGTLDEEGKVLEHIHFVFLIILQVKDIMR